jgi:hypothetical protein
MMEADRPPIVHLDSEDLGHADASRHARAEARES